MDIERVKRPILLTKRVRIDLRDLFFWWLTETALEQGSDSHGCSRGSITHRVFWVSHCVTQCTLTIRRPLLDTTAKTVKQPDSFTFFYFLSSSIYDKKPNQPNHDLTNSRRITWSCSISRLLTARHVPKQTSSLKKDNAGWQSWDKHNFPIARFYHQFILTLGWILGEPEYIFSLDRSFEWNRFSNPHSHTMQCRGPRKFWISWTDNIPTDNSFVTAGHKYWGTLLKVYRCWVLKCDFNKL